MNRLFLFACVALPGLAFARYTEELHESNDGAWMFAYVILLFIGVKYIRDEMKKGSTTGVKAGVIVGALAAAAYMFPIINGILVAVVGIAFVYGMFKSSGGI